MAKAISSHLVPANAACGPSGTARYAVRLDGSLAWAGPDFALSAVNPALFANWHVYASTHPQANDIRFLRVVSEKGDVSHQPIGTFAIAPVDIDSFPVYKRRGSGTAKGSAWYYDVVNVKLVKEPLPGIAAELASTVIATPEQIPMAPDGTADTTALVPVVPSALPAATLAAPSTETAIATVAKPTFIPDSDGQVYGRYTKNGRIKHRALDATAIQEYLDTGKEVYVRGHLGKNVRYLQVDQDGNPIAPTEIAVVS